MSSGEIGRKNRASDADGAIRFDGDRRQPRFMQGTAVDARDSPAAVKFLETRPWCLSPGEAAKYPQTIRSPSPSKSQASSMSNETATVDRSDSIAPCVTVARYR